MTLPCLRGKETTFQHLNVCSPSKESSCGLHLLVKLGPACRIDIRIWRARAFSELREATHCHRCQWQRGSAQISIPMDRYLEINRGKRIACTVWEIRNLGDDPSWRAATLELVVQGGTGQVMVQVKTLRPAVYIHCDSPRPENITGLKPLLQWGGEAKHISFMGSYELVFVSHILQHYENLPEYLLFSSKFPEVTQKYSIFAVSSQAEKFGDHIPKSEQTCLVLQQVNCSANCRESIRQRLWCRCRAVWCHIIALQQSQSRGIVCRALGLLFQSPFFPKWGLGDLASHSTRWLTTASCQEEHAVVPGQILLSRSRLKSLKIGTYEGLLVICSSKAYSGSTKKETKLFTMKLPLLGLELHRHSQDK